MIRRVIVGIGRSRWFRTGLGAVLLAALVWFIGPVIGIGQAHPLETEIVRAIVIAAIFVLWLVENLFHELRARKRDAELAAAVAAPGPDADATASAEEVALLSDRLREALAALKKSKLAGSKRRLAAMPWYMFIGPPGAGKTTALLNCGLKFPLADAPGMQGGSQRGTQGAGGRKGGNSGGGGAQPLRGVGGTRNCDWWFTDDAVLIDTAGRYTTQDSQAAVDSAAWLGFLKLLKKHRRRQPLNGVLVAISLSDLSVLSEEERLAHAQAIRRRVRELHDELGVRPPVYVLFTKADLMEGFAEFFDNLGKEEREQVWGATYALDDGKSEGGAVAAFDEEFDLLLARLNDRMLERVHQEADMRRRRLIYGFPQQMASLRDVASEFLHEAFRPSRLEARPLLRGAYLTSGTQEGTPIDRLLGTMAAEFGLPRQTAASGMSGTGRSYFLSRLIREVVFGEASLVSTDPKEERRARWISRGAYAACAAVLLLLGGVWLNSYIGNRELIAQVHAATTTYNTQYGEIARRGPSDAELPPIVPALDTLRGIHGGYGSRDAVTPVALTFGLYQGAKLGIAATEGYVRVLNRVLLPRLIARAEAQVASRMNSPDALYQLLKVYLILGKRGPIDHDLIVAWLNADLLNAYPGEDNAPMREALAVHTDALLQQPLEAIPLNDALVQQARSVLKQVPAAEYSYNRLMRNKRVQGLPAWSALEEGGPAAGRVFQSRSGRALEIPGIFTRSGYHNLFKPLLATVTQDLTENRWVLEDNAALNVTSIMRDSTRLRRDVTGLYLEDYVRRWDALIADIMVKPFNTMQDGLDQLSTLSGPISPLRELVLAIAAQTRLSPAGSTDAVVAAAEQRALQFGRRAAGIAALEARAGLSFRQAEIMGSIGELFGTDASGKPIDPATRVDDHFKAYYTYVATSEGNRVAPIEATIQRLETSYRTMNQASTAAGQGQGVLNMLATPGGGGGAGGAGGSSTGGGAGGGAGAAGSAGGGDPAAGAPPAVANLVQGVARNTQQVVAAGASQELTAAWRTDVVPLCDLIGNRYPIVSNLGSPDAPADDVARLLGPGGKFDGFFEKYLKPFVDTTRTPWQWRSQAPPGVQQSSLVQFENAQQIREALFANGNQMQVRFQLVPVSLDPRLARVTVDIGGTTLTNEQGPPEQVAFQWPGPGGKTGVRVVLTPAAAGGNQAGGKTYEAEGPWALLRLLAQGTVTRTPQPDKVRVTFQSPSGPAIFDLNASSVRNPFTLQALGQFRCPARL